MSLIDQALKFLARREYSEKELARKLHMQYPNQDTEIKEVLEKLKAQTYLNNQRFLESRIRHRLAQGYGSQRIILELTQVHGLDRPEIVEVLKQHAPNEGSSLEDLIRKKIKHLKLEDPKARTRVIAYCLARGFLLSEIKAALHAVSAQVDCDSLD